MAHGKRPVEYRENAYLSGMIAHHEAAVVMSEELLKSGKDTKVRGWAEDIIKAQKSEIETMRGWLGSVGGAGADAARGMRVMMGKVMEKLMSQV